MGRKGSRPEDTVFGLSPLGGNSTDGTEVQGVPLFWDERAQAFISEQAVQELDDRDIANMARAEYEREDSFRQQAGFEQL